VQQSLRREEVGRQLTAEALGSVYSKTGTTYTGKGAPHQLIGDGAATRTRWKCASYTQQGGLLGAGSVDHSQQHQTLTRGRQGKLEPAQRRARQGIVRLARPAGPYDDIFEPVIVASASRPRSSSMPCGSITASV